MKNTITPSKLKELLTEENMQYVYSSLKNNSLSELNNLNPLLIDIIKRTKALCRVFSIELDNIRTPKELLLTLEDKLKEKDDFESKGLSGFLSKIRKQVFGLIESEKRQEFEKLKLEHSLHLRALDNSAIVQEVNPEWFIVYANKKTEEISGKELSQIIWRHTSVMNSKYHSPEFWIELWKTVKSWKVWNGEIRNKKETGGYYWTNTTITPFMEDGKLIKFIVIRFDTTELHEQRIKLDNLTQELERKNELLQVLSITDGLTGLKNRRAFDSEIEDLINNKKPCLISLFDIDFFKKLNDEFWHQDGDKVLINIWKFCLEFSKLHPNFKIFRYGWEEFSIIIEWDPNEVETLIYTFFNEFNKMNLFDKRKITISLWYSLFKEGLNDYKSSLEPADTALYSAKDNWRNCLKKS